MEAFHNDPIIKEKYLTRLQAHYIADEIIKGQYWEDGKGCAVGCTIHSENHKDYETELGISEILASLQDKIFEGLPNNLAKEFPLEFLSAINVGSDLSKVSNLFMIWILTDPEYGVLQFAKNKKVIQDIANAFVEDMVTPVSAEKWKQLRNAAYAVGENADATAAAAAYAAFYSYSTVSYAKSKWYIAASKKLIELLKQTN